MKKSKAFLLAALSAGWLLPLHLTVATFRVYFEKEFKPEFFGRPMTQSFPMLDVCFFWFVITELWLGLVIMLWIWFFLCKRSIAR